MFIIFLQLGKILYYNISFFKKLSPCFYPFIGLSYSFMVSEEINFKGFPLKNIAKRKQQVQRHKGNLLASKNYLDLLFDIH